MPEWFAAPSLNAERFCGRVGHPAAEPYDGQRMYASVDRPGRLSLDADDLLGPLRRCTSGQA